MPMSENEVVKHEYSDGRCFAGRLYGFLHFDLLRRAYATETIDNVYERSLVHMVNDRRKD